MYTRINNTSTLRCERRHNYQIHSTQKHTLQIVLYWIFRLETCKLNSFLVSNYKHMPSIWACKWAQSILHKVNWIEISVKNERTILQTFETSNARSLLLSCRRWEECRGGGAAGDTARWLPVGALGLFIFFIIIFLKYNLTAPPPPDLTSIPRANKRQTGFARSPLYPVKVELSVLLV